MRCLILVIFGLGVCMLQLRYVVSVSHTGLPAASGETEMMAEPDECEHKGCDCNCNCASPVPVYPLGGSHVYNAAKDEISNDYGRRPSYSGYSGGYSRPKCINRDCECECNCLYNSQYTGQQMNAAPIARINPAAPELPMPGVQVILSGSESYDPEGGPLSFDWSYPSGVVDYSPPDLPEDQIALISVNPGDYKIKLFVTDDVGLTAFTEVTFTVLPVT